MSNSYALLFTVLILFGSLIPKTWADVGFEYQQSGNAFSIYSQIKSGVDNVDAANNLLQQTLGQPQSVQSTFRYVPKTINPESVTLSELRIDGLGYAVSNNPVLPSLYAWVGYGPGATVSWQLFDIYGGYFWNKQINAVSTDLIDRKLVDGGQLMFLGGGIHVKQDFTLFELPSLLEVQTKSTWFYTTEGTQNWYHRWRVSLQSSEDQLSAIMIAGPQPLPDFGNQTVVWDNLWQLNSFPDLLSAIGLGLKYQFYKPELKITAGFFGGYFGGAISYQVSPKALVSLQSYGIETSSAFQAQQLRMFGAGFQYSL